MSIANATASLANHARVEDFDDVCPVHGGEIRGEWDFGMQDATVQTFHGCRCAVCHQNADVLSNTTYHTSYADAAGRANLIKAKSGARWY